MFVLWGVLLFFLGWSVLKRLSRIGGVEGERCIGRILGGFADIRSIGILFAFLSLALAGCNEIPYRKAGFAALDGCADLYERIDDPTDKSVSDADRSSTCWQRAREERKAYDTFFVEFDDQGWVRNSATEPRPKKDFLDDFFAQFERVYDDHKVEGLSLVVFVHGWHHNANAFDENVREFRRLLRDIGQAEAVATGPEKKPKHIVGIYVGWRGESISLPILNYVTFWDRKNTAERVAQGSVRELIGWLDRFRDQHRDKIHMLTIGHSFGGLIVYEAMAGELMHSAIRAGEDRFLSRLGDLVVIVNPAFEGARYEALMAASRRHDYKRDQLPAVVIATSIGDDATGFWFPLARWFNTLFESAPGPENDSIVMAVGHNERYITHRLDVCGSTAIGCELPCGQTLAPVSANAMGPARAKRIRAEAQSASTLDFSRLVAKTPMSLEEGLALCASKNWKPVNNPFWVVSTSAAIMQGHNDIFNPHFTAFIRQIYTVVLYRRTRLEKQRTHPISDEAMTTTAVTPSFPSLVAPVSTTE